MGSPIVQFLNQYSFLFVCAALLIGGALYLRLRQASGRWWGVWGVVAMANVGVVMMLPTAAVTLADHEAEIAEKFGSTTREGQVSNIQNWWVPPSVSDLEALVVTNKNRPTLVE